MGSNDRDMAAIAAALASAFTGRTISGFCLRYLYPGPLLVRNAVSTEPSLVLPYAAFQVRNTFIDDPLGRDCLTEGFLHERQAGLNPSHRLFSLQRPALLSCSRGFLLSCEPDLRAWERSGGRADVCGCVRLCGSRPAG